MRINCKLLCDDYFVLTTIIGGKQFSVTYSPSTSYDDAIADFKQVAREKMKDFKRTLRENTAELPPDASPEASAVDK
jgi:hypothetical protein